MLIISIFFALSSMGNSTNPANCKRAILQILQNAKGGCGVNQRGRKIVKKSFLIKGPLFEETREI